jgi:hypothetical protein
VVLRIYWFKWEQKEVWETLHRSLPKASVCLKQKWQ